MSQNIHCATLCLYLNQALILRFLSQTNPMLPSSIQPKNPGFSKSFIVVVAMIAFVFVLLYFKYVPSGRYETFVGVGKSMYPTFTEGQEIIVDTKASPLQGDAIVFDCLQCQDLPNGETLTKRVYQINNAGCYWLMGDNQEVSYDSRVTGWLCPDEHIRVHGVVIGTR